MWFTNFIKKKHSLLTKSRVMDGFPVNLHVDVQAVLDTLAIAPHEPHMNGSYRSVLLGAEITIPARVYFPASEIKDIAHLSVVQQAVFAAVMTRHFDGHQREYWVRVLCSHPSEWTASYLAFVLGDYVVQVLATVDQCLTPDWYPLIRQHAQENHICLKALNHRILNYWTLYYRYHPPNYRRLKDYPGYIIAERLGLWDKKTAPKLLRKRE